MNCIMLHLNGHQTDRHFQTNRFEFVYEITPRVLSFSTQRIDVTYKTLSSWSHLEIKRYLAAVATTGYSAMG